MQMPRHSDHAKRYFRSLVPDLPMVEVRPMFGSAAAFVNGNMFAGLFGDNVGVKLDGAGLAELAALPGSGPFVLTERILRIAHERYADKPPPHRAQARRSRHSSKT